MQYTSLPTLTEYFRIIWLPVEEFSPNNYDAPRHILVRRDACVPVGRTYVLVLVVRGKFAG